MTEDQRYRAMIEAACKQHGYTIQAWQDDPEEGRERAILGTAHVYEDDDEKGLYAEDDGQLSALVVGAAQYGNERVMFTLMPEGFDVGEEVQPDDVEVTD
jgi:hypothetical protein